MMNTEARSRNYYGRGEKSVIYYECVSVFLS